MAMKISIHNDIEGGYPFVEAIEAVRGYVDNVYVVDMQSTDGTRGILELKLLVGKVKYEPRV